MAAIILHVISNDLSNFTFLNTWCTFNVVTFGMTWLPEWRKVNELTL